MSKIEMESLFLRRIKYRYTMPLNIAQIRAEFPILTRQINHKQLIYLDNAATTQKPQYVIDAITRYYANFNANVHRGIHTLSQEATDQMETSRELVQHFIGANEAAEIIFTRGTTESINLVANGLATILKAGDEIVITELEHHANIVPWQMLSQRIGTVLKVIPVNIHGVVDLAIARKLITPQTKLVAFGHISNALGIINPINDLILLAQAVGAYTLVDGAQAIPHLPIDVSSLGVDFYTFSAHKMYGPTGIGVLYGKREILAQLQPWQGGGEMIETVTFSHTTYADLPFRLEAGTPHIEGIIGLKAAIEWIQKLGITQIQAYEENLLRYVTDRLSTLDDLEIYALHQKRAGVLSFNIKKPGVHSSDVGNILDKMGIAVRTGHHCAQPIMRKLNIPGTVRASFAVYNTHDEIDTFVEATKLACRMLCD